jgi:broad-specificity NMP kinase
MRIGVAGTHGIGKTTLVADLSARHPDHVSVAEPYVLLEDQGYAFDHPPSQHDYMVQFTASLRLFRQPTQKIIFDRTPLGSRLRRQPRGVRRGEPDRVGLSPRQAS